MSEFAFAGYPAPFIFDDAGNKIQQLIWGDFVRILGDAVDGRISVKSRRQEGWMREGDLQPERLLEVNFVDIGQGDGSFVVTPSDEFMLIDAGQNDNMFRFLNWRFNMRRNPDQNISFGCAVISHPDQDHYKGFAPLFSSDRFSFDTVFHNGIVERGGGESLGPRGNVDGVSCLVDVIRGADDLKARLADPAFVEGKQYPRMLADALERGAVKEFVGLNVDDGYLPGYEEDQELSIRILGPWPEAGGSGSLRWFGDVGKTKNGHSVVLKVLYRNVKLMLGGDLNVPAENHLLANHCDREIPSDASANDVTGFVAAAREIFEVDIAKACHHGSADFTNLFLAAVNPLATVISSGDDEPHAHPRPDALGAFGKFGRGDRPLIFSTELARSANENIRDPHALRREIDALYSRREAAADNPAKRATIDKQIQKKLDVLERSVAVYGLINLRTDGRRVLMAQKLERPRGNGDEWDVHRLEPGPDGRLRYVPKHGG